MLASTNSPGHLPTTWRSQSKNPWRGTPPAGLRSPQAAAAHAKEVLLLEEAEAQKGTLPSVFTRCSASLRIHLQPRGALKNSPDDGCPRSRPEGAKARAVAERAPEAPEPAACKHSPEAPRTRSRRGPRSSAATRACARFKCSRPRRAQSGPAPSPSGMPAAGS